MNRNHSRSIQDLLDLFSDLVSPEEVIFSRLSAEISVVLTKERIKRKMTQAEFASFLNVKQSQVSKWENGGVNFSLKTIAKLAALLDLETSITAFAKNAVPAAWSANISTSNCSFARVINVPSFYSNTCSINDYTKKGALKAC